MIEKYFKSSILNILERGFYLFGMLISYMIVARTLGLEQFGEFTKLLFIYQILSFLSTSTADQVMQNSLSKGNSNIFQEYFIVRSIFSLFALVITLLIFQLSYDELSIKHYLIAFIHIAFILHSTESIVKYHGDSKKILHARFISSTITLIARIFGWLYGLSIEFFIFTFLLEAILYGLFLNFLYMKNTDSFKIKAIKIPTFFQNSLLKKASYLFASAGIVAIYSRMDFISLYIFSTPDIFGKYSAIFRLMEIISIITITLITSIYPYLAKNNIEERTYTSGKLLSFILLLSVFAIILYSLIGTIVIKLIYGQEFVIPNSLGIIILLSIVTSSQVIFTTYLLLLLGLEKVRFYRALLGLSISLCFVLPSTYYFGIYGAAISSFVVQISLLVATFYLSGAKFIGPIFKSGYLFKNGVKIWNIKQIKS